MTNIVPIWHQNWVHRYYQLGLSIFPLRYKSKSPPKGIKWSQYQSVKPPSQQISVWLSTGYFWNIAVICGNISNNLVCFDFDDPTILTDIIPNPMDLTKKIVLGAWVVKSPRGYHIYLRSDKQVNFTRLVSKSKKLELRGNKTFVVLPPSTNSMSVKYRLLNTLNPANLCLPDKQDVYGIWDSWKDV